ncbi:hypothetical protein ABZ896_25610 [Streptomyces sp. NPDC047072]|uniref:hypothetical protein n=1 Tax=Streptomyces sp. NPDC047072 TaxID=3154809 RepID=UPI0033EC4875
MTDDALFALEAVVVAQPKRSRWRTYRGPALAVSTVEGTPLAHVTHIDDTLYHLTKPSGELVVRIERHTAFWQFGPVRFRFLDAVDREVGSAEARGLVKSAQLSLRTERQRALLLTRLGLSTQWRLAETDPLEDPAAEALGTVTVSTIDAWLGLQQYVVRADPRLDASERRTLLASVACLHLVRRPPGSSAPG